MALLPVGPLPPRCLVLPGSSHSLHDSTPTEKKKGITRYEFLNLLGPFKLQNLLGSNNIDGFAWSWEQCIQPGWASPGWWSTERREPLSQSSCQVLRDLAPMITSYRSHWFWSLPSLSLMTPTRSISDYFRCRTVLEPGLISPPVSVRSTG